MGGQACHRLRLGRLPPGLESVELCRRDAELVGVATDLVQRDEPGVAVEGGVLDPLGHGGATQLLQPTGQLVGRVVQPRAQRGQRVGELRTALGGRGQGAVQVLAPLRQVRAVHLECHRDLGQRRTGAYNLGNQGGHPPDLRR